MCIPATPLLQTKSEANFNVDASSLGIAPMKSDFAFHRGNKTAKVRRSSRMMERCTFGNCSMYLKKFKTVIWDWNGTLLDDVTLSLSIVNEILSEHNVPKLSLERYREIFDFPVRLYYERAGLDLSVVDFEIISGEFCYRFESRLQLAPLFPSVNQALDQISQSGARQFLLSSTEHHALNRMVKNFGLEGKFDAAKGMTDGLATGKLSAGKELLDQFHIEPSHAVFIGDTVHDAEVADSLGIECLLISSGHHSHERLSRLKHPVFSTLDMLFQ